MIGHNEAMRRRWGGVRPQLGRSRRLLVVALTMVALASCSGDDDDVTPATSEPTPTVGATDPPATTAGPATTETAPSTTEQATTLATEVPTTAAPAATTAPPASTVLMSEEAVRAAVQQLHSGWTECLRQLPNCDAVLASTEHAVGELSDALFVQASASNQDGRRAENVDSRTLTIESVLLDPTAGTAAVVTCENDGAVLLAPDGSVINDKYVSRRIAYTFVSDGRRWLGSTGVEQQRADGLENGLCGPTG